MKPKVKACVNCRNTKKRCDGAFPICSTCSRYPAIKCVYGLSQREKTSRLDKKETCLPCRRKKKRCDADQPWCSQCKKSRKRDLCVYEIGSPDRRIFRREHPRQSRLLARQSSESSSGGDGSLALISKASTSTPKVHLAYQPLRESASRPVPPFHVPSLSEPCIIPNPRLYLDDYDDPYAFALSEVSLEDLNLKLLTFLEYEAMYGVFLASPKRQALIQGDITSGIVHPFFVHFAHLMGCQFYQERMGHYFLLPIQFEHLRLSLEALRTMKEANDPLSFVKANFFIGTAYAYVQFVHVGNKYLKIALQAIRRNSIRFVSRPTEKSAFAESDIVPPPPISEPLEIIYERCLLLGEIVYLEVVFYMIGQPNIKLDVPLEDYFVSQLPTMYQDVFMREDQPTGMPLDLECQFRYELPEAYQFISEVCPIVLRVRSALFCKDASNLTAWLMQTDRPSPACISTCSIFLDQLTRHITRLTGLMSSKDMTNQGSLLCLRFACIISLTNLAQITFLLAKSTFSTVESAAKFRGMCKDALKRTVTIVEQLEPEEFLLLDVFLMITWIRALVVFNSERSQDKSAGNNSPSSEFTVSHLPPDAHKRDQLDEEDDLVFNIGRIAQLNDMFMKDRYLPGTTNLCAQLGELNAHRVPRAARTKV